LKTNIPMGDFTNHHNNLKYNLIHKLVQCSLLMMAFSMLMYILSYFLDYFIWIIIDEALDIIAVTPLIYALRLRYLQFLSK